MTVVVYMVGVAYVLYRSQKKELSGDLLLKAFAWPAFLVVYVVNKITENKK